MIKVTPDTYIRAESDRSFANIQALAGGVNRWYAPNRLDIAPGWNFMMHLYKPGSGVLTPAG